MLEEEHHVLYFTSKTSKTMNQFLSWSCSPETSASDSFVFSLKKNVFIQISYIHPTLVFQISFSSLFFHSFPFFHHTADVSPAPLFFPASPFSHTHTLALAFPDVCWDDVMADWRHWTLIPFFFFFWSRKHSWQTREHEGEE